MPCTSDRNSWVLSPTFTVLILQTLQSPPWFLSISSLIALAWISTGCYPSHGVPGIWKRQDLEREIGVHPPRQLYFCSSKHAFTPLVAFLAGLGPKTMSFTSTVLSEQKQTLENNSFLCMCLKNYFSLGTFIFLLLKLWGNGEPSYIQKHVECWASGQVAWLHWATGIISSADTAGAWSVITAS